MLRTSLQTRIAAGAIAAVLGQFSAVAKGQTSYQATDLSFAGNYGSYAYAVDGGNAAGSLIYNFYWIRKVRHNLIHAVTWAGGVPVDLNPAGSTYSIVGGVSAGRQAGTASVMIGQFGYTHATLWSGTAASAVDINPVGFDNTSASGIRGKQVVGQGTGAATGGYPHAMLWRLDTGAVVDLNATTHQDSGATATNGSQQVGWATDAYGASEHAMFWQGSSANEVDLNPSRWLTSNAFGIDGAYQVGYGYDLNTAHALLWHGTAGSAVDLNPTGFIYTYATAISGGKQAGYGTKSDYKYHALVWSGKASSYVDLQAFLPAGLVQSYAYGVDASGNVVGYAVDAAGVNHPIIWKPLP